MAEPKDLIVPMLREIRMEMSERFDGVSKRFDGIDKRLESIDGAAEELSQRSDRRHHDVEIHNGRF